jgi:transcriptional regulator with XRE-family HTH domain
MFPPGLRLRQTREKLGLTYRDVESASLEIATRRGRPDFILHISRLADIENHNVVPTLHKLYSLAVIYHLDPMEIASWYEAPLQQTFHDGASFPPPQTYLSESLPSPPPAPALEANFNTQATGLLNRLPAAIGLFPGLAPNTHGPYRYGYIGLSDRRMTPILRPGSLVLVDTSVTKIEVNEWSNEYDRPLYFVELRGGYRCGWFQKEKSLLIMQPHTLSHCTPESWRTPEEAEVVGQVVGLVTYLNEPWASSPAAIRPVRSDLNRRVS